MKVPIQPHQTLYGQPQSETIGRIYRCQSGFYLACTDYRRWWLVSLETGDAVWNELYDGSSPLTYPAFEKYIDVTDAYELKPTG